MTIKQMHYFIAVAETLSFTQAAKRFYVAQTAVSQQIASLERELNLVLFRRNNRRVELTEAGRAFYREIRPLVIRLEEAIRTAADADERNLRRFDVGITPNVPAFLLPSILKQFCQVFPYLNINLHRDRVQDLSLPLKNGDLDAALMVGETGLDPRLVASVPLDTPILSPFLLAVPPGHPAYNCQEISWEGLTGTCIILSRDTSETPGFAELEPYVLQTASTVGNTHSADSTAGVLALVEAGLGLGLLPDTAFGEVPRHIHLVTPVPCPPPHPLTLYYHRNNSRPELETFVSICRESLSSISVEK